MSSHLPEAVNQELNISNIMALTARLAQILAHEADLLASMKVQEIEPLQKEKIWLTKALELQHRRIQKYPELLDFIDPEEREELRELVAVFDEIKDENHRRLMAAKEVNQRVVEAITEIVNQQSRKPTYTEEGVADQQSDALSVTLNKTI